MREQFRHTKRLIFFLNQLQLVDGTVIKQHQKIDNIQCNPKSDLLISYDDIILTLNCIKIGC